MTPNAEQAKHNEGFGTNTLSFVAGGCQAGVSIAPAEPGGGGGPTAADRGEGAAVSRGAKGSPLRTRRAAPHYLPGAQRPSRSAPSPLLVACLALRRGFERHVAQKRNRKRKLPAPLGTPSGQERDGPGGASGSRSQRQVRPYPGQEVVEVTPKR